jgi:hypothetical protein
LPLVTPVDFVKHLPFAASAGSPLATNDLLDGPFLAGPNAETLPNNKDGQQLAQRNMCVPLFSCAQPF